MTKRQALEMLWNATRLLMLHHPYPQRIQKDDADACDIMIFAEAALRREIQEEIHANKFVKKEDHSA